MAIPASNQLIDYMEYYKLSDDEYHALRDDPDQASDFADSCRRREAGYYDADDDEGA
ncbi:hypothetical protein [Mycolicibacterium baixiangningiae]|uniref:hypothetical protein n=1 Tax=Mycolicibacterium baixiangningiae TaxID=2761578 RepID=UPI0018D0C74D|nr:hypothetical protein [Mycolicibacterium baixiangningiae]